MQLQYQVVIVVLTTGAIAWRAGDTQAQVAVEAAEDICQSTLPVRDKELMNARKRGDARAIRHAAEQLAEALVAATGCPVLVPLYRAHVAESRCDALKATTAYWEYDSREQRDTESKAKVRKRIAELEGWQQSSVTVRGVANDAQAGQLQVTCTWAESAGTSRSACAIETQEREVHIDRPANADCHYRVAQQDYETAEGTLPLQAKVELTLVRSPPSMAATETHAPPDAQEPHAAAVDSKEKQTAVGQAARKGTLWDTLGQRPVALVLGVGGVATIATGAIFGGLAIAENADSRKQCVNDECTPEGARHRDAAFDRARVSTVAFVGGAVLLASSVILYVLAPSTENSNRASIGWAPSIERHKVAMTMRGAF